MFQLIVLLSCLSLTFGQNCCTLYRGVTVTNNLNVRACAATGCAVIGSLPPGSLGVGLSPVNCSVDATNCWVNIRVDAATGILNGYAAFSTVSNSTFYLNVYDTICDFTAPCAEVFDWILLTDDYLQGKLNPSHYRNTFAICNTTGGCGFPANSSVYLRKPAADAVSAMYQQFLSEVNSTGAFAVHSGQRTFATQNTSWTNRFNSLNGTDLERVIETAQTVSMPGTSRYHWGGDFGLYSTNNDDFNSGDGQVLYDWLVANAHRFNICLPFNEGRDAGVAFQKFTWSHIPTSAEVLSKWLRKVPQVSGFVGASVVPASLPASYLRNINPACLPDPCTLCRVNDTVDFGAAESTLFCMCCSNNCFGQQNTLCPGFNVTSCIPPVPTSAQSSESGSSQASDSSASESSASVSSASDSSVSGSESISAQSSASSSTNNDTDSSAMVLNASWLLLAITAVFYML